MDPDHPKVSKAKPWALSEEKVAVVSLAEIMAEEMQKMSTEPSVKKKSNVVDQKASPELSDNQVVVEEGCQDDFLIAKMLQSEFDRENDARLDMEEKVYNKGDRVSVSFSNFKSSKGLKGDDGSQSDEDETFSDDRLEEMNNKIDSYKKPRFGPSGVTRQNGVYITKHDKVICGRNNTSKVMNFPPGFQTGDAAKMDVKLSNRVYNSLKRHTMQTMKRQQRVHEKKEKSTAEFAVDEHTRIQLYKLINLGVLQELTGVIATGKEAVVFHSIATMTKDEAIENSSETVIFQEGDEQQVAVKIYKTTLSEFKNRRHYVQEDYRFKNPRKVMRIWAEREFFNLKRLHKAGVSVPLAFKVRDHLLVMEFIGSDDGMAAPKIKDVQLDLDDLADAFDQVRDAMIIMYKTCGVVHADLSEFNLLYWEEKVYVIDLAQAVEIHHEDSLIYLARDCKNICNFFYHQGLETVSTRRLFNQVSGKICSSDETFLEDVKLLSIDVTRRRTGENRRRPAERLLSVSYGDSVGDEDFPDDH